MTDTFFHYPEINMLKTGENLYTLCDENGFSVSLLERLLCISNQSIYNWFQGKALPSLDNFYALSSYLGTELDSLIVPQGRHQEHEILEDASFFRRQAVYFGFLLEAEAQSSS